MKLARFFEKFDQLADAPNAVAKMRELILQLAAHGKLAEQSPDDQPASKLLSRIESHFEQLRSRKELRGLPVEPIDREHLPLLPASWEWVPLGNVVDYGSSDKSESADIPENAWLLDLEDIEKDTSRLLRRKTFRERPSKSTKTAFVVGDVLYGKLRPYLNKVLVADAPGYCTTEIIPIRTFGFIEPAYLCYALKRPEFLAYANSKSYGMNLPRLGTEDARRAAFPLPPLAEQKRIVAKVDELMALCDRLEAQQRERDTRHAALARASLARFAEAPTPANLDFLFHNAYTITPADLRKSILTLAVQGKLVPQDPNDEPAESILRATRSLFEKLVAAKKLSVPKPLPPIADDEVPFSLPSGWAWCRLGQFMRISSGDGLTAKDMNDGPFPVYGGNGVNGYHNMHNVSKQTLVIGRVGFYCGSIRVTPEKAWVTDNAFITTFDESHVAIGFLCWLLKATDLRERDNATAQPVISGGKIYPTILALPPLAEQRRIVAKVDQLMALVDQLETQLTASRATAEKLMEAVVVELAGANRGDKRRDLSSKREPANVEAPKLDAGFSTQMLQPLPD